MIVNNPKLPDMPKMEIDLSDDFLKQADKLTEFMDLTLVTLSEHLDWLNL